MGMGVSLEFMGNAFRRTAILSPPKETFVLTRKADLEACK
jgi:hypothetical protein